jgi:hypothetical protein
VKPALRKLIEAEFRRGAALPLLFFPPDGSEIPDSPKLTIIVAEPNAEWSNQATIRQQIGEWTKRRGKSDRLYPGSLIWCLKKPGRDLRDKVEPLLLSCHRRLVAQLYPLALNQRQRRHLGLARRRLLKSKLSMCSEHYPQRYGIVWARSSCQS